MARYRFRRCVRFVFARKVGFRMNAMQTSFYLTREFSFL